MGFPHIHTKLFFDTSWVPYNSSVLTLSRDSIRFHRFRAQSYQTAPHFRCQSQAQVVVCVSDQLTGIRGSHRPWVRFRELWEAVYSQICLSQTTLKATNEQQPNEEIHKRYIKSLRTCGVQGEAQACLSPGSPTWELSKPNSFGFLGASLHRHDWLNQWQLATTFTLQPIQSPEGGERGANWKFQSCDHVVVLPGNQPPSLSAFQKSPY